MAKIHTHYDNLKLDMNASPVQIHSQYAVIMKLILENSGIDESTRSKHISIVKISYDVLLDPDQRRAHDDWIVSQWNESIQHQKNEIEAANRNRELERQHQLIQDRAYAEKQAREASQARNNQSAVQQPVSNTLPVSGTEDSWSIGKQRQAETRTAEVTSNHQEVAKSSDRSISLGQSTTTAGSLIQFKAGGYFGLGEDECEISSAGVIVGKQAIKTSDVISISAHSVAKYVNFIKTGTASHIVIRSHSAKLQMNFYSPFYGTTASNKYSEVLNVLMEHQGQALLRIIIAQIDRGEKFHLSNIVFDKTSVELTTKKFLGSDKREVIPYDRMAFTSRNGQFIIASDRSGADGLSISYEHDCVCLMPHLCSFLKTRAQRKS